MKMDNITLFSVMTLLSAVISSLTVGGGCRRAEIHAGGVGHERVPVGGHDAKSIYYRGDVPLVPASLVHDFATSDSSHALGW